MDHGLLPRHARACVKTIAIVLTLIACQNVNLEMSKKPDRPANLSATPADAAVMLAWDEAARAEGYEVYWKAGQSVSRDDHAGRLDLTEAEATVSGLINGQSYAFIVVAVNDSGAGEPSQAVTCAPTPPPAAPLDVAASPGDSLAVISWASSQGADGYVLYYRAGGAVAPGDQGVQRKVDVSSPYTVMGLENGVIHAFAVAAYNAAGEGSPSAIATTTPSNANAPHDPSPADGADGVPLSGPLSLTWLTTNPNGNQLSFDVYLSLGSIPSSPIESGLPTPACSVDGPFEPHAEYRWRVSVNNISQGYRSEGPEWSFMTANTPPPAPTLSDPAQGATDVDLSTWFHWNHAHDPDEDAVAYDLLIDTANPPATVAATGLTANEYQVNGLTADTLYYWRVVARDGYGGSAESSVRSFRTIDPPAAPTALAASADPRYAKVNLSWTSPGGPVSGYRIYRSMATGGQGSTPIATTTGWSFEDTGFFIGDCAGTYYYRVSAYNAAGEGPMSAESLATGSAPTIPVPSTELQPHNADYHFQDRYFLAITPNSDGALSSRQYRLNRIGPDPQLSWVSGDVAIYVNPIFAEAAGPVTCTYRLQSRNEWGDSAWSGEFSVVVPAALPIIYPTITYAGAGRLDFTWSNPAGATKLRIFLVDQYYETAYSTSVAATPPATSYSWTGLSSGSKYAFVIVPYDDTSTPKRIAARLFTGTDRWTVDSSSLFVTVP